jgi:GTP cyclohydrolase I
MTTDTMTTDSTRAGGPALLPDVQATPDTRGLALDQVGIRDLRYPIDVLDRTGGTQRTIASLALSVGLPHHFKGTHMSRFVEVLSHYRGEFTMRTLPALLDELRERLGAETARVELRFPYFIEKRAPVSGLAALMDIECGFTAEDRATGRDFVLVVKAPVASLCPCSKEISEYGAHNQRGEVEIEVRPVVEDDGEPALIWFEELLEMAEASASAPLYPLLKRPDERFVTMQAYENPAFVEDIAREVAVRLHADERVASFRVRVTNFESIHNHNAFAEISGART